MTNQIAVLGAYAGAGALAAQLLGMDQMMVMALGAGGAIYGYMAGASVPLGNSPMLVAGGWAALGWVVGPSIGLEPMWGALIGGAGLYVVMMMMVYKTTGQSGSAYSPSSL
jgi:hypothetical protein